MRFSVQGQCRHSPEASHCCPLLGLESDMSLNPIGVAVPFFFALIAIEFPVLRRQERPVRINDAITDMSCGLGDQLISIFTKAALLVPYVFIVEHYAIWSLASDSIWTWILGTLGVDVAYYWFHRFGHRVNFGWAWHVVHHQSEEYNLSVALRQPWFAQLYSWIFYLPLALIGVPVEVYATSYALNLLYQFWIHTETIGRLGPFEWIFNSPSHHRVHHGTNPRYLDKNYAGIFIIWDRMFGTFQEEDEKALYGTLKPLRSWNPLWANVQPWMTLVRASAAQEHWLDKLKIWFMPPAWSAGVEHDPASLFDGPERGYDVDYARSRHLYIIANLGILAVVLGIMLTFENQIPLVYLIIGGIFTLWTAMAWGGFFEGRKWARPAEGARLVFVVALCAWFTTTWPG